MSVMIQRFLMGLIIMNSMTMNGRHATTNHTSALSEVRAYIKDIEGTRQCLENLGATLKSDYLCIEFIYAVNSQDIDLDTEFIRLRYYSKMGCWNLKRFCLAHKKRELPELTRKTIFSYECDTFTEAQELLKNYTLLCSYSRKGWEYYLGDIRLYIEDIQGINPSIEIIAPERKAIDEVLAQLPIEEVVCHSLPTLVYRSFLSKFK